MIRRKSIFITGAARGIGLETARLFAGQGWLVGAGDVDEAALASLADELGDSVRVYQLDVTRSSECKKVLKAFCEETGGYLHVLFNNAGILKTGAFEKLSPGTHHRVIDVNVNGVINMAHAAFRYLRVTPEAKMVSMSSASAAFGIPDFASYSASKFAVRALTEALSIEWRRHDIHVMDIMPPFVNTEMVRGLDSPPLIVERLGVSIEANEIATAVWEAVGEKPLHKKVTLPFTAAWHASRILPEKVTKFVIRKLAGY